MSGLRQALALLTRIPAGLPANQAGHARSALWVPVVGAAIGALIAVAYSGLLLFVPPLLAGSLAVGLGLFITGALHEDGLADTADAFWGGWDREQRLRILRDPRHGTYGVLAIAVSIVTRIAAVSSLGPTTAIGFLPAAHALSRATAVAATASRQPAAEGMGAWFISSVGPVRALGSLAIGSLLAAVALGWWGLPALVLSFASSWLVGRMALGKIGGVTGDVMGAAQQVAELSVLILAAGVARAVPEALWWAA